MPARTPQKTAAYSTDQAPEKREPRVARGKKMSDYGRQLAEKQKAKFEYGLREAQFRRYFLRAAKSTVATGQALFAGLETRLDNVLYRTGIAKTRRMARQLVSHGLIVVNEKRISMPSYTVSEGDSIRLKDGIQFEYNKEVIIPDWLSYNNKTHSVRVERMPKAEDLVTDINSQLIIEFYSR
jgi:small subunit ribosomal protein S4